MTSLSALFDIFRFLGPLLQAILLTVVSLFGTLLSSGCVIRLADEGTVAIGMSNDNYVYLRSEANSTGDTSSAELDVDTVISFLEKKRADEAGISDGTNPAKEEDPVVVE